MATTRSRIWYAETAAVVDTDIYAAQEQASDLDVVFFDADLLNIIGMTTTLLARCGAPPAGNLLR